jgi:arylsulfatase A-like enzyme
MDPFVTGLPWMEQPAPGQWRDRVIQSNAEYAAMVEAMDENVGRVMTTLEKNGLAGNTVVIFMADNGGLSTAEGSPTSNLPLRGGKGWLYEGGIREPMIVRWPGLTSPGTVCEEPVTSTDFYPTMLDIAGLPARASQHQDGVSLVPLLKGAKSLDREAIYWHYPHYSNQGDGPGGVIRSGDYKLIEHYEDNSVQMYNLRNDIGETRDLAKKMPEKAQALRSKLANWRKSVNADMPRPNPDYDPSPEQPAGDLMNEPK